MLKYHKMNEVIITGLILSPLYKYFFFPLMMTRETEHNEKNITFIITHFIQ